MNNTKNNVRKIIREFLHGEVFQSHRYEPAIGDRVINTNTGCEHFGSEGVVLDIKDLPHDMGKACEYEVTNTGDTYQPGDILIKTMDQLSAP